MSICPRCRSMDSISAFLVPKLKVEIYVCRFCDTLWTHRDIVGTEAFVDAGVFLQTHGLTKGEPDLVEISNRIASDPTEQPDLDGRVALGRAFLADGKTAEALHHFEAVLELQPSHVGALEGAWTAADTLRDALKARRYGLAFGLALRNQELADGALVQEKSLKLTDVVGMDALKRQIQVSFLGPLKTPELRKLYRKSACSSLGRPAVGRPSWRERWPANWKPPSSMSKSPASSAAVWAKVRTGFAGCLTSCMSERRWCCSSMSSTPSDPSDHSSVRCRPYG